jgi:ADP-ribosylglycohydrolase
MSASTALSPPQPLRHCYWVIPGLLLAGEHPAGATRDKTKDRLKKLLAVGIESILDLTKPTELQRYDMHLPFYVEYRRSAIKDHGVPGSPEQMAEILEHIGNSIRAGRPVYVHCRAGIGRTGTVIGCLLVERGLSGDGALDELNRLWQQCKRSRSWAFIPETEAQAAYVRNWKPSLEKDVFELTSLASAVSAVGSMTATHDPEASAPLYESARATRANVGPARGGPGRGEIAPSVRAEVAGAIRTSHMKSRAPRRAGGDRSRGSVSVEMFEPQAANRVAAEPTSGFDPLLEPATLVAARNLRERFVGTLSGLAVGDAIAAATQFRRPGSFAAVGDMIGGGPFDLPRGAWSDDTAMALCLAESLLERDGFDARDQVQRYSRWQQEGYLSSTGQCVGITASTARSLALAKWRRVVFPGSHDPEQLDPEPLSRVAAIALYYFASAEATDQQSAEASRTTCQAPAVLEACRQLGRVLNAALSGQPKARVLADAGPVADSVAAQTNNTAPSALAAALWAFSSTDNFRDAVLRAANVGGNSDVVAAVCGQLAGAFYGASAIPPSWRNGLIQKDLIEDFADRLLAHGLVALSH